MERAKLGREEEREGEAMAGAKKVVRRGGPADKHPGKAEGLAFVLERSATAKLKLIPPAPLFNQPSRG